MPPSINLIAFFEQVAISCFFSVYLLVISLKKQNDTRQKKKKGIIVSCIYLQGFPAEMSKYSISWELSTHIA